MFLWLFIVFESIVIGLSAGLFFVLGSSLYSASGIALGIGGAVGLLSGLALAWLVAKLFGGKQPTLVWLWVYTLASSWLAGTLAFYLASANTSWQAIMLWATAGTVPGMLISLWLTWYQPLPRRQLSLRFTAEPDEGSLAATVFPQDYSGVETAESRLSEALTDLARIYQPARYEISTLPEGDLLGVLRTENHLGRLSFYFVCNQFFPQEPPQQVYIEVENAVEPVSIEYEGAVLQHWNAQTGLVALVKDATLQVEETLIR
jgi:hypothetical protein